MAKKTIEKFKLMIDDATAFFFQMFWMHAKDSFGVSQDNLKILWTWQTQGWS